MCDLAKPAVCWLVFLFLRLHLVLGPCTLQRPGQEERDEGMAASVLSDAGPGEITLFRVIPSYSPTCIFFLRLCGKDARITGQKPISNGDGQRGYIGSWTAG